MFACVGKNNYNSLTCTEKARVHRGGPNCKDPVTGVVHADVAAFTDRVDMLCQTAISEWLCILIIFGLTERNDIIRLSTSP